MHRRASSPLGWLLVALSLLVGTQAACEPFNDRVYANCTIAPDRTYLLHRPETVSSGAVHALVLSFHGAGGKSSIQATLSQFSDPGLKIGGHSIFAAYPQGLNGSRGTPAWEGAPYAKAGVDDVTFSLAIVQDVSKITNAIDSSRVYAAGKSNGGGFVNLLACTKKSADVFSAFAAVSPALYAGTKAFKGCKPGRPIPMLSSHGTSDQTIPFLGRTESANSTANATPDIYSWISLWATRNGCKKSFISLGANPTAIEEPFVNATRYEYACSGASHVGFTNGGLGHSWPTTEGLDRSGAPNNTASYNLTSTSIIPFFDTHTLP